MDYSRLLGDALSLTWRHRFLWLLGLFGGTGTCSPSFNYNLPSLPDSGRGQPGGRLDFDPRAERMLAEALAWVQANVGLLVAIGLGLLVLFLVLLAIHFIAEGALISALGWLAAGERASLGTAWGVGLQLAWRYVGLWLLGLAIGVAIVGVVAIAVGALVLVGQSAQGLAVALGVLLGLVGILLAIPFFIAAYIVFLYAERGIAVDGLGTLGAVERGIGLLRARLGPSLLLWLISLAVGIAAAIGVAIVVVIALVPVVAVGVGSYFAFGLSPTLIGVGIVLGLVAFAVLLAVLAVVNTFTAAYWTLGYLALTDRYPPPAPAVTV
jgi:hypothetical protein